nr:EOG090X0267 [Macrothrix elegans]
MASSDWLEVQRLAAEFQRAQLSSSLQKLSERNCVEIISKLIELKLIDIYYTNDGKEYVTPQQLSREISDELYLHGGRIELMELVSILNVNYEAIEARALDLVQNQQDVHLVSGQLISDEHLDRIAEEINETLQQNGQFTLVDLTKQYELPIEFLLQVVVNSRLGTIIQGQQDQQDPHVFFTEGYLARNKARIRGALSAITVPTPISSIVNQNKFPERLFFSVLDELVRTKRIEATVTGGRQVNVATIVPDIYSRSQSEWVQSFLKQNGYLEYDALTRLGLPDPKGYCRKRFKETSLLYLSTCCVGTGILEQVEAAIEEAFSSQSWVDIMQLLPSVFNEEDAELIIREVLKRNQNLPSKDAIIIGHSAIASGSFIKNLTPIFDTLVESKAKEVVASGAYLQSQADQKSAKLKSMKPEQTNEKKDRKEERRKKASEGKVGGGVQGRETKTKSTKKKYLKGKNESDDEDVDEPVSGPAAYELEFLSVDEIVKILRKQESLGDASDEIVEAIAVRLHKPLQSSFQEAARVAFEVMLAASSSQRRKTHGEVQDKIQTLLQNMKQNEKAILHFTSLDTQQQLSRHLLKTTGSELLNELVLYVSQDQSASYDSKDMNPEIRQKLINDLPQELKAALQALHKAALGSNVEEFLSQVDNALSASDIVLRKADKKKDKGLITQQRFALIDQLNAASDPALVLHVAVLLIFHTVTQTVLNATGRFVPQIVAFLQPQLPAPTADLLTTLQGLVIQELTSKGDEETLISVRQKMEEIVPKVREAAVVFKKSSAVSED